MKSKLFNSLTGVFEQHFSTVKTRTFPMHSLKNELAKKGITIVGVLMSGVPIACKLQTAIYKLNYMPKIEEFWHKWKAQNALSLENAQYHLCINSFINRYVKAYKRGENYFIQFVN